LDLLEKMENLVMMDKAARLDQLDLQALGDFQEW
jgi:hypothetical protein